jgi:hypothetical protein
MIKSKNIYLRMFETDDAEAMLKLQKENRDFFGEVFNGSW